MVQVVVVVGMQQKRRAVPEAGTGESSHQYTPTEGRMMGCWWIQLTFTSIHLIELKFYFIFCNISYESSDFQLVKNTLNIAYKQMVSLQNDFSYEFADYQL